MLSRGRRLAASALALTLLGGTVGCGGEDRRELESGEAARVLDDPAVARLAESPDHTALLPVGELQVGWSDEPELLGSVTDDEGRPVAAAEDAELVAVAWDLDVTALADQGIPDLAAVGTGSHELALVSGGERTVLAPEDDRSLRGAAVAAVPDATDATDLALEITFDGVTQRIGPEPGEREVPPQAQVLYDGVPRAEADLDCVPARAEAFCRSDAAWLPWVADQGWAPEGRLWPVVRVAARVPGTGTPEVTATLDGTEPVATDDLGATDGAQQLLVFPATAARPAVLAVDVAAGQTTVTGEARLSPSSATGR